MSLKCFTLWSICSMKPVSIIDTVVDNNISCPKSQSVTFYFGLTDGSPCVFILFSLFPILWFLLDLWTVTVLTTHSRWSDSGFRFTGVLRVLLTMWQIHFWLLYKCSTTNNVDCQKVRCEHSSRCDSALKTPSEWNWTLSSVSNWNTNRHKGRTMYLCVLFTL